MVQTPEQAEATIQLRRTGAAQLGHEVVEVIRQYVEIPSEIQVMRACTLNMMTVAAEHKIYTLKAVLWIGWPQASWIEPGFGWISDGQKAQAMEEFLGRMRLDALIPISTYGYTGMKWELSKEAFIPPNADPENVKKASAANNLLNGK